MAGTKEEELEQFAVDLWTTASRLVHTIKQPGGALAEEYGLTAQQVFNLWRIAANGPLTMSELAGMMGVSQGVATRAVSRLQAKGMVERRRDASDRRIVWVSISELGARIGGEAITDALDIIKTVFKDVSAKDREEYLALMRRIEHAQSAEKRPDEVGAPGG